MTRLKAAVRCIFGIGMPSFVLSALYMLIRKKALLIVGITGFSK
ncbi:MAG: hypothetical protein ACE5I5_12960 [Candidatus Heimdallarchaeota archaeon]